jgi:hypothetical protein
MNIFISLKKYEYMHSYILESTGRQGLGVYQIPCPCAFWPCSSFGHPNNMKIPEK